MQYKVAGNELKKVCHDGKASTENDVCVDGECKGTDKACHPGPCEVFDGYDALGACMVRLSSRTV